MSLKTPKPELLAPAGDEECLEAAINFGADAVYLGGRLLQLRASRAAFDDERLEKAVSFAHSKGKKVYVTVNSFAFNDEIAECADYARFLRDVGADAAIISDIGVLSAFREAAPELEAHVSTQANTMNYAAAMVYRSMGAKRIVLARELSLDEIKKLRDKLPEDVELETFVHGAMCMAFSGRCILSSFLANRSGNRGECSQPCRWNYALTEEKRPGEYFPVEEDSRGTYFMNSHDLCMIQHIPDLINAGLSSLKIEGRMKSVYYVAATVRAYRLAIDAYYEDPEGWKPDDELYSEVCKVSHRNFTTGFFYGNPGASAQNYSSSTYIKEYSFTGMVISYDEDTGTALVEQRNKMTLGDTIEVFGPGNASFSQVLTEMYDAETGERLESCPHAQQMIRIKMEKPVKENYLLRKKI